MKRNSDRARYLGLPASRLPLREKLSRLENRVRQLEAVLLGVNAKAHQITAVKKFVARQYRISCRQISSQSRAACVIWPRYLAIWLARELLGCSLNAIAEHFGRRDPSTIRWSLQVVNDRLLTEPATRREISALQEQVKAHLTP